VEVLRLRLDTGEVLELTPTHRLYLEGHGWTPAGELRPHAVLRSDRGPVRVEAIESAKPNQRVYNLEVGLEHAYRVAHSQIWAHNQCARNGPATMDTAAIRFTQSSVKGTFKDGTPIQTTIDALKGPGGDAVAQAIPPIRIFEDANGAIKTLDNRRLLVFSEAETLVPYVWATPAEVAAESWKFTATPQQMGGWFIRVKP
jgi:hypothetical protein